MSDWAEIPPRGPADARPWRLCEPVCRRRRRIGTVGDGRIDMIRACRTTDEKNFLGVARDSLQLQAAARWWWLSKPPSHVR